jgi:hypothetical protein
MSSRPIRLAATLAATALAGSVLALAAPAAQAAPVYVDAETNVTGSAFAHDDASCTESGVSENGIPAAIPVVENGPAVTAATSSTVTNTAADPTDVMTSTAALTATGSVSSANGSVKAIDFSASGQQSITSTKPVSACSTHAGANVDLNTQFTVTQPGFLTVTMKKQGGLYSEFYLEMVSPTSSPYYDSYSEGLNVTHSAKIYLPAGLYDTYSSAFVGDSTSSARVKAGTATIHAAYTVAGSQTVAPSGKGGKYLTLPAARSCATHALSPTVTTAKKAAKKIKMIKIFVNDQLAKKVKKPHKGSVVTVPLTDNAVADVSAEVTLFPKRKGAKSKVYEVSASYEACTS